MLWASQASVIQMDYLPSKWITCHPNEPDGDVYQPQGDANPTAHGGAYCQVVERHQAELLPLLCQGG